VSADSAANTAFADAAVGAEVWRMDRRDVVVRAIDRGIIPATGVARALARVSGVSHETARRWFNGVPVTPANAAKLRAVLGLEQSEENSR